MTVVVAMVVTALAGSILPVLYPHQSSNGAYIPGQKNSTWSGLNKMVDNPHEILVTPYFRVFVGWGVQTRRFSSPFVTAGSISRRTDLVVVAVMVVVVVR